MSLFADYKNEREGKTVIETESVLCIYSIDRNASIFYVEDIYVDPKFRKSGVAKATMDHLAEIAKKEGFKYFMGSVAPSTNGSTNSLRLMLEYGFKLKVAKENIIYLQKEL